MTATLRYQLRAPWYARLRGKWSLDDEIAKRPFIQGYAGRDFAERIVKDPTVYLKRTCLDHWGYPCPRTPGANDKGRDWLATYKIHRTLTTKLYQPSHDRFYAVVVEVFCDQPGLPRAASHDDFEVGFVMRRHTVSFSEDRASVRKLATNLIKAAGHLAIEGTHLDSDVRELWWTEGATRRFLDENASLVSAAEPQPRREAWIQTPSKRSWETLPNVAVRSIAKDEETHPMWRLPRRDGDCEGAETRSLWFGIIPTFSGDHETGTPLPEAKLDDHGIYELVCFVKQKPLLGHEHCPPKYLAISEPSEPFHLAAVMDPEGTRNLPITIALPDFRRLAASAANPQGAGGVRVVTPPGSRMVFNPFDGPPKPGKGAIAADGGICTFAIELFFIVAFFLFLMFLPIVVLAFQLWWMLALRFCIPPSVAFGALADAAIGGGLDATGKAQVDVAFGAAFLTKDSAGNDVVNPAVSGTAWFEAIKASATAAGSSSAKVTETILRASDPAGAKQPTPPEQLETRPDPLCKSRK